MNMNKYGFIITRHVNSEQTNFYWNHNIKLLKYLYPNVQIVIIDDNSNYDFVKPHTDITDIQVIQSEFPGRGELLPYYYLLKYKFFENALIIHDSVFIHRKINFDKLRGIKVLPLWFFHSDTENIFNTKRIIKSLRNHTLLEDRLTKESVLLSMPQQKWYGCFGVQSYINLYFLEYIERKYGISNLVHAVHNRRDRCCLERIFGCIFFSEYRDIMKIRSILGDIMKYQTWGYTYNEYIDSFEKGNIKKDVIKVWTGR